MLVGVVVVVGEGTGVVGVVRVEVVVGEVVVVSFLGADVRSARPAARAACIAWLIDMMAGVGVTARVVVIVGVVVFLALAAVEWVKVPKVVVARLVVRVVLEVVAMVVEGEVLKMGGFLAVVVRVVRVVVGGVVVAGPLVSGGVVVVGVQLVFVLRTVLRLHLPYLAQIGARFVGDRVMAEGSVFASVVVADAARALVASGVRIVALGALRRCLAKYPAKAAGAILSKVVVDGEEGGSCARYPAYKALLALMSRVSIMG